LIENGYKGTPADIIGLFSCNVACWNWTVWEKQNRRLRQVIMDVLALDQRTQQWYPSWP
jgi:hypothetical protein